MSFGGTRLIAPPTDHSSISALLDGVLSTKPTMVSMSAGVMP